MQLTLNDLGELGFDYLRDQMAPSPSELALREKSPFNFAVVDEATFWGCLGCLGCLGCVGWKHGVFLQVAGMMMVAETYRNLSNQKNR